MFKFNYGNVVVDEVLDCIGVVTSVWYSYGKNPTQYLLEKKDKSGRPFKWWVNEDRLKFTEECE